MMTRRERIIYLAALFEGEGCFTALRPKNKSKTSIRMHLWMSDEDIIRWAAELVYSLILRRDAHPEIYKKIPVVGVVKSRKPLYGFILNGERAIFIMKEILPFMGLRRSAKIMEVIQAYESRVTLSESHKRASARRKRCLTTQDLFQ